LVTAIVAISAPIRADAAATDLIAGKPFISPGGSVYYALTDNNPNTTLPIGNSIDLNNLMIKFDDPVYVDGFYISYGNMSNTTATIRFELLDGSSFVYRYPYDTGNNNHVMDGLNLKQVTSITLYRGLGSNGFTVKDVKVFGSFTEPMLPPTGLTAIPGNAQVFLSWSSTNDAVSYKIYRNGQFLQIVTGTSYTDTPVTNATTYAYAVSAVNDAGYEGSRSPPVLVTLPDLTPPAVPVGLVATSLVKSIDLSWDSVSALDFAGYNVYRNGIKVNSDLIIGTTYHVTNVDPDVQFAYQVSAVRLVSGKWISESNKSISVFASAMDDEHAPNLTVSDIQQDKLRLNWDNVAPSYEIYQDGVMIKQTHTKFLDITHLDLKTAYQFYVVAIDKYGRRIKSNVVDAVTLVGQPAKPQLQVSDIDHKQANISWVLDKYTTGYTLSINGQKVLDRANVTSYLADNLDEQTIYKVEIIAHGDESDQQANTSFTTLKKPVPTISHASVQPIPTDPGKRQLSYTPSNGVTGVNVYVNGNLIGTYPADQTSIELDYSELTSLMADIKVEPVDPDGVSYEFANPVKSTGAEEVDGFLGKFIAELGIQRNAFIYIALASIPLFIIVAIFFFLRPRTKKMILDKDDNKPFGVVDQSNPRAINQAQKQGFKVDDTRDERKVYNKPARESKAQQLGFKVVERKERFVPVGFMGSGGYKKKIDVTYERKGVEYKERYVKGQGKVFVPKDTKNQMKHMGNQLQAFKSAFSKKT